MDELSREALETVARLRRRGLVSDRCPNAGSCQCPEHSIGLLGPARLRVVTMPADTPPGHDPASMICPCAACELDRQAHAQRAKRQIRQPWEARRAA